MFLMQGWLLLCCPSGAYMGSCLVLPVLCSSAQFGSAGREAISSTLIAA